MDEMNEAGDRPVVQAPSPAESARPAPTPTAAVAPPVRSKGLSTGAKWAIGLTVAFVVLVAAPCALTFYLLGGSSSSLSFGESVAVVYIDDAISGTYGITPESVGDQLDSALADPSVKAIVLRIDSPGGTVAASQELAAYVQEAAESKPVVTSVGDICASGGYMVAAQSDEIFASRGSTVGSIGVIMQLVNVEGLLDKVGVEFITLTQGEYKDAGSAYRSVTETETAMLDAQMALVYEQFIADVASGRDMSEAEVRELATGWAWLGSEALELGLIDEIGTYNDALDRAAGLGGIEGDYDVVTFEYVDPVADLLTSLTGIASPADQIDAAALRRQALPR